MADERKDEMTSAPAFDDDRLLAFALGLDDDPELVAAAAADEGLRRRLDVVRAEVEQVGAQVRAAVPGPDEHYTDPSDPRWAGLREFFAAPQPGEDTQPRVALAARSGAGRGRPRGGRRRPRRD